MSETARTKDQIQGEYDNEAAQLGHKSFIVHQIGQQMNHFRSQAEGHLKKMLELNEEMGKLKANVAPPPPESL